MAFNPDTAKPINTTVKTSFNPSTAKPININSQSVLSNDVVVDTNLNDATKVNFMADTQVKNTPRENYFGMQQIDDGKSIQDLVGLSSNKFQDFTRAFANDVIEKAQDIKRFGTKIGARALITSKLALKKLKTGEDVGSELSEWNKLISQELGEVAKTNLKYRQELGIAKTEYDGLTYDLGSVFSQLGMSVVTKSPTLMTAVFGMQQQQQISEEVFAKTGGTVRGELVGTAVAIPTAALEYIGLDRYFKVLKGSKPIANIVEGFITEAIQEGSQQIVEEVITQSFGGREKDFEDTLKDTAYSMILGGIAGGGTAGMVSIGNKVLQGKGVKNSEEISQKLAEKINNNVEIHKETADIIKRQNDNTTNYGNNIDNGISEVKKSIQEKGYKVEPIQRSDVETLFEEARGNNINIGEQELFDILDTYNENKEELQNIDLKQKQLDIILKENPMTDEIHTGIRTKEDILNTQEAFNEFEDIYQDFTKEMAQKAIDTGKITVYSSNNIKNGTFITPSLMLAKDYAGGGKVNSLVVDTKDIAWIKDTNMSEGQYTKLNQELNNNSMLKIKEAQDFNMSIDNSGIDLQKAQLLKDYVDGKIKQLPTVLYKEQEARIKENIDKEVLNNIDNNLKRQTEIANQGFIKKSVQAVKDFSTSVLDGFNAIVQPTSSTIEKIDPKLWLKLNKYLYTTGIKQKQSVEAIKPFIDKFSKLSEEDFYNMDFYMKNISTGEKAQAYKKELNKLLEKNDMIKEYEEVRKELNSIYTKLKDVGVDIGYLDDYIPRMVDPKQKDNFLSYLMQSEKYSSIMYALEQEKFYQDLSTEEKVKFVNNYLRGFIPQDIITLQRIGNIKFERKIQEIDADLNQFYLKSGEALIRYIESTQKTIEQKKLFGSERQDVATLRTLIKRKRTQLYNIDTVFDKQIEINELLIEKSLLEKRLNNIKNTPDTKEIYFVKENINKINKKISFYEKISKEDLKKQKINKLKEELEVLEDEVKFLQNDSIQDSVGRIVYDLSSNDKITADEERLLKKSLSAIIDLKPTPRGVQIIKNLTYALTLGNIKTTITQIGDLGLSIYKNDYMSTIKAIGTKNAITIDDLGIDNILGEIETQSGLSKFLNTQLKLTGLTKLDATMKNIDIQSNLINTKKLLLKGDEKINKQIDFMFDEYVGQSEQVKQDIINGKKTEDVGFYVYNSLSATNPINIGSMPLAYLNNPNMRFVWALKTYAIKQLDFTRKEIFAKMRKEPLTALKNLVKLQTALLIMGATKDLIKSLWDDEDLDIEDVLLNNLIIYNTIGKYTIQQAMYKGVGSGALTLITPPAFGIVDKIQKGKFLDIIPFGKDIKAIKEKY
jgi:hypothetical protein